MDYGKEARLGKCDTKTQLDWQRFLWTNYGLYRVQEEVQTGMTR